MRGIEWFRRAGDIPGLDYSPPVPVDRAHLPRHDAVPEARRDTFDGRVRESLNWTYPEEDGTIVSTSASPAHGVAFGGLSEELASTELLQRLWEGLELPGQPSDYHFAIQLAAGALWGRRVAEPDVLAWVEFLHWLDIKLIRVCPDAVKDEFADDYPGRRTFFSVSAFDSLITMYSREGYLGKALSVACIAEEFGQGERQRAELEERLAVLRAEDDD